MRVAWPLVASLVCACDSVPTLTFAEGEAGADVASDAQDAATDGGCPGSDPPPAPFVCCGAVACEGLCTGQCDACAAKCTLPGQVCCGKNNNVVCIDVGAICH